jgi:putative two-component system response regulator
MRETILIVEDNPALREGLHDILEMEAYTVLTAGHGEEALKQIEMVTPDLIISDIAMPVMDGYAFFALVRARPAWVSIPFIFLTARGERDEIMKGKDMGAEDYLVKPLGRDELLNAVRGRLSRSHQLRIAQLYRAYEDSLTALANAIDVRDSSSVGHVERVRDYTQAMADVLGYQGRILQQIRFGAILHDLGKITISEDILLHPGPLSEAAWVEVRRHPVAGADMIRHIEFLRPAAPIIRYHHERWDGGGYPDGLKGEKIPLGARIVAVADSFDSMTINQVYRQALSAGQAFAEIRACSGAQYDPAIVQAFTQVWEQGKISEIHARWQASTGAAG